MAFERAIEPAELPRGQALDRALAGIGVRLAARPDPSVNIEDTLLAAVEEGLERDDLRLLSLVVTWFGVHHERVIADRLVRVVGGHPSRRVRAFWAALARWQGKDRRWARLAACWRGGRRVDLLPVGTAFQVRRRGEDERFAGGPLRVPAGVLRDRPSDVADPATLCRQHRAYRWRVIVGPTYRADMWALLEAEPGLSAAELARRTYGSFATAWQARRDFLLVHGGQD